MNTPTDDDNSPAVVEQTAPAWPVIALVGRPNVGKSTLYNRLTRTRDALVADQPGLTRDRKYGVGRFGDRPYLVVDTGGLLPDSDGLDARIGEQALIAAREADRIWLLVDAREGLSAADQRIAADLRRLGRPLRLVVNKGEHLDPWLVQAEFHSLGLGEPVVISAAHGHGVAELIDTELDLCPTPSGTPDADDAGVIRVAVVGRPNVGKSTLINRWLGEERLLAFDAPGTTRDSIAVPFEHSGRSFLLIDTAGVRRRARVHETIEKFSIVKTLESIERAHVVVMVLDARQGIADQDAHLLGSILDSGRALVLAVNKWDRLEREVRDSVRREIERRLVFVDFVKPMFVSALHGSGVFDLLTAARRAFDAAMRPMPTAELTRTLAAALAAHPPPLVHGHSIKLRYAHLGGHNPPVVVVHGNRIEHIPDSYRRYLIGCFRKAFDLRGTPLRIEFRTGTNPYAPQQTARPADRLSERARRRHRRG